MNDRLAALALVSCIAACSSDDGGSSTTSAGGGGASTTTTSTTSTSTSTGDGGAGAGGDVGGAGGEGLGGDGGGDDGGGGAGAGAGGGPVQVCLDDPPHTPMLPPAPPEDASPGEASTIRLGISRLFLGDTDRDGVPGPDAWRAYGYDVDLVNTVDSDGSGGVTDADLRCHCSPFQSAANAKNLEDADGGIDNSFGRNFTSFLKAVLADPSDVATQSATDGVETSVLELRGAGGAGDAAPSPGAFFTVRDRIGALWAAAPESLDDADEPAVVLPDAYLVGNKWVSGTIPTLRLPIVLGDVRFVLAIHDAVVSMELSDDRTSATNGIISGHVVTEELAQGFGEALSMLGEEGLCPGDSLYESVVQTIRGGSDIGADGRHEVGATCNGTTVGIGFEAEVVEVVGVADELDPVPSCD